MEKPPLQEKYSVRNPMVRWVVAVIIAVVLVSVSVFQLATTDPSGFFLFGQQQPAPSQDSETMHPPSEQQEQPKPPTQEENKHPETPPPLPIPEPEPRTHLECKDNTCTLVEGEGENECDNEGETCGDKGTVDSDINTRPFITSFSHSPDPVGSDNEIAFTVEWSDFEGDQSSMRVCSSQYFKDGECFQREFCSSEQGSSPTTCSYVTQDRDKGRHLYYIFVCDEHGLCGQPRAGTFTVE